jgi:hypothetical protein
MQHDGFDWLTVLENAERELGELQAERSLLDEQLADINKQIIWWEQILSGLRQLQTDTKDGSPVAVEGVAGYPLGHACRIVLQNSTSHRTARGIRDSLEASGYNLSQHGNALASIHGVLKRMVEKGEVEPIEIGGKTRYRWKSALEANRERILKTLKSDVQGRIDEEGNVTKR